MFDQLTFLALAAVAFLAVPGWVWICTPHKETSHVSTVQTKA